MTHNAFYSFFLFCRYVPYTIHPKSRPIRKASYLSSSAQASSSPTSSHLRSSCSLPYLLLGGESCRQGAGGSSLFVSFGVLRCMVVVILPKRLSSPASVYLALNPIFLQSCGGLWLILDIIATDLPGLLRPIRSDL